MLCLNGKYYSMFTHILVFLPICTSALVENRKNLRFQTSLIPLQDLIILGINLGQHIFFSDESVFYGALVRVRMCRHIKDIGNLLLALVPSTSKGSA